MIETRPRVVMASANPDKVAEIALLMQDIVDIEPRPAEIPDVVEDADTLATVTWLVEWPTAIAGGFDPAFLEIPDEVILTTLKSHQKLFCVRGDDGAYPEDSLLGLAVERADELWRRATGRLMPGQEPGDEPDEPSPETS